MTSLCADQIGQPPVWGTAAWHRDRQQSGAVPGCKFPVSRGKTADTLEVRIYLLNDVNLNQNGWICRFIYIYLYMYMYVFLLYPQASSSEPVPRRDPRLLYWDGCGGRAQVLWRYFFSLVSYLPLKRVAAILKKMYGRGLGGGGGSVLCNYVDFSCFMFKLLHETITIVCDCEIFMLLRENESKLTETRQAKALC